MSKVAHIVSMFEKICKLLYLPLIPGLGPMCTLRLAHLALRLVLRAIPRLLPSPDLTSPQLPRFTSCPPCACPKPLPTSQLAEVAAPRPEAVLRLEVGPQAAPHGPESPPPEARATADDQR